jgi:hypothetical protein
MGQGCIPKTPQIENDETKIPGGAGSHPKERAAHEQAALMVVPLIVGQAI